MPSFVCRAIAVGSGIECATRMNSAVIEPISTMSPACTVARGGSGRSCSDSLASTIATVNGSEMMRPIGVPVRIRCASAATWSSWACVTSTASTGLPRITRTSGRKMSTPSPRSSPCGKPMPQSITMRTPSCSTTIMFRPTSPSPPMGVMRIGSVTRDTVPGRGFARAGRRAHTSGWRPGFWHTPDRSGYGAAW